MASKKAKARDRPTPPPGSVARLNGFTYFKSGAGSVETGAFGETGSVYEKDPDDLKRYDEKSILLDCVVLNFC